jgi:hypothetical protein
MRIRVAVSALALIVGVAPFGHSQEVQSDRAQPGFEVSVIVRPRVLDFNALVLSYFELRTLLQAGLPVRRVTDNPDVNLKAERALAERIREARAGAERGDIFTPAIADEFRRILLRAMDPVTLAVVMDDNPGGFVHRVNGTYPKRRPLSTMPGNILAVLPFLPDGLEYRFLGHDLILLDTRANVILDRISCAIECVEVVD